MIERRVHRHPGVDIELYVYSALSKLTVVFANQSADMPR
jgi:hypothetical protein